MKKQILSLLLAAVMLVGVLPMIGAGSTSTAPAQPVVTTITSLTYNFTAANVAAPTPLTFAITGFDGWPRHEATATASANGAVAFNFTGLNVQALGNMGFVEVVAGSPVTLALNNVVVNGTHTMNPTQAWNLTAGADITNGLLNQWTGGVTAGGTRFALSTANPNTYIGFTTAGFQLLVSGGGSTQPEPPVTPPVTPPGDSGTINTTISPQDFVNSIGAGWNLGNTFDAISGNMVGFPWLGTASNGQTGGTYATTSVADLETAWIGGTAHVTTQEFIQALHGAGFRAIRIPVSWNKAAGDAPNYTIREDWMARVKQVVQWAYDLDMHIVLNTHHENAYFGLTNAQIAQSEARVAAIWTQIATEFRDYDEKLIFAGLNEPRGSVEYSGPGNWGEWTGGVAETRANLNRLNQTFVNTVRATGGNNAQRFLAVPTHAASATPEAFSGYVIPTDPANRVILTVHTYSPFNWAHNGVGQYAGASGIRSDLDRVKGFADALGVPVMLTEWGSINNGNPENLAQREQHAYDYVSYARSLGMATFWWDNNQSGGNGDHTFGLFNRQTRQMTFPTVVAKIMEAMNAAPPEEEPAGVLSIQLKGLCTTTWADYESEVLGLRGDGQHTLTLNIGGGVTQLGVLNITHVGDITDRFRAASITVDTVTINNNPIGHTHTPLSGLVVPANPTADPPQLERVDTVLWNNWWAQGSILTTGVTRVPGPDGGENFALAGNAVINTIVVTFTINGVTACPDCTNLVCTCTGGSVTPPPPVRTITRSSETVNCTACSASKLMRVTTVSEGTTVVATVRAAKRNDTGALIGGGCVQSLTRPAA